jgi:signal transduction histidine kinase
VAQNTIQERGQANVAVLTSHVNEGVLRPVWVGDILLLVRRVSVGKSIYVQGAWLNWPAIHAGLLASSQDLLPEADLRPIDEEGAAHAERRLAALPARLVPGSLPPEPRPAVSMARLTLAVAWCGILLAALAVGALLLGTVSLSERRGAFVSAVTHELRTPLTTFRLYTEMLAEGMVQSEEKQRAYLQTLKAEAERLNHLVENVLAYARLERGRGPARPETVTARDLVDRMEDRLAAHARQHGMDLAVEVEERIAHAQVRTDVSTVEQILLNLVDNACKYAAAAADRRIHLAVKGVEGHVEVSVRDHGPGIARTDRRRLFRPFSKSAREAANSAPGIGLGLALSRRLARTLGGDLRLDETVRDGASLDLLLPLS